MEWTSAARQALHEHVSKSTNQDSTSEIYNDIFTDLTAHVEEEMHQNGVSKIDTDSLQAVLTSMGGDEFDEVKEVAEVPVYQSTSAKALETHPNLTHYDPYKKTVKFSGFRTFCVWLFTIIIPSIALIMELANHESRSMFFDPIPTWIHVILIALVPITFISVRIYRKKLETIDDGELIDFKKIKTLKAMLGFILPVIVYYTILFIPVTPLAVFGCIILLGFLPLAPLFCFMGWFWANSGISDTIERQHLSTSRKWLKYGLISGLVCLVALETPAYLAQKALTDAVSKDVETSQRGIENIRRFGGDDTLLYLSYHGESRTTGFSGRLGSSPAHWVYNSLFPRSISSKQARVLYYKVTGTAFNSVKPPENSRGAAFDAFQDWSWDQDHGGDSVAGITRGLSLHSSRMDMHVDDETRLGYVEWIIEFKNEQRSNKEARMQIALPHNGFVSKLTLWVDGEERPAAFNTVSKVKAAYKAIAVEQRKDPVLVNVSGADRVMLQCFPVPANGGLMKMKVGITFPLSSSDSASGNVHFPYIAERNFSIAKELKHEVYAQGNLQINAPNASLDESGNITTLQYALPNPSLKTERITWKDLTPSNSSAVWTLDPYHKGDDKYLTRQVSSDNQLIKNTKNNVIVVVDGSASMDKWKPVIGKLIDEGNSAIEVYVTGNHQVPLVRCETAEQFDDIEFVGGIDNVPALREALLLAKEDKANPSSILWIHGSQPIQFPSIAGLEQDLERLLTAIPIYDVALEDGANTILAALKGCPHFKGGCRVVNETDLIHMAEEVSSPQPENRYTWTRSTTAPLNGVEAWDQLARKWAYEDTMSHLDNPSFATLAAHYQLVTPLSGAVVLETRQQYIDTGLDVPNSANSPSLPVVPEPSSSLLILIGAFMATMRRNRCA